MFVNNYNKIMGSKLGMFNIKKPPVFIWFPWVHWLQNSFLIAIILPELDSCVLSDYSPWMIALANLPKKSASYPQLRLEPGRSAVISMV